jgi:hypothetical protein
MTLKDVFNVMDNKFTKQEVADFYMLELINIKDENEAIKRLCEWLGVD